AEGQVSISTKKRRDGGGESKGRASTAAQEPDKAPSAPKPSPKGKGEDLLTTNLSPIAPLPKRPRKLLGGGTSRCKTPQPKKKSKASRTDEMEEEE
ncbi:unnamed protein product, partial [Ectocarpus sp. 12 AP-2014]